MGAFAPFPLISRPILNREPPGGVDLSTATPPPTHKGNIQMQKDDDGSSPLDQEDDEVDPKDMRIAALTWALQQVQVISFSGEPLHCDWCGEEKLPHDKNCPFALLPVVTENSDDK